MLACSFGLYGLLRKTASLGALEGLALETLLLAPLVLPALAWWTLRGSGAMAQGDGALAAWLVIGGPLTALPLLLFAASARRLPLATVGLLQYLSPTIQLALGVWVFHEPFDRVRLLGFGFIWAGLALYSADGWRRSRQPPAPQPQARRRADQVVEGRQRRLGAVAGGDDDLLERHRGRIARGEHAGQRWSRRAHRSRISP